MLRKKQEMLSIELEIAKSEQKLKSFRASACQNSSQATIKPESFLAGIEEEHATAPNSPRLVSRAGSVELDTSETAGRFHTNDQSPELNPIHSSVDRQSTLGSGLTRKRKAGDIGPAGDEIPSLPRAVIHHHRNRPFGSNAQHQAIKQCQWQPASQDNRYVSGTDAVHAYSHAQRYGGYPATNEPYRNEYQAQAWHGPSSHGQVHPSQADGDHYVNTQNESFPTVFNQPPLIVGGLRDHSFACYYEEEERDDGVNETKDTEEEDGGDTSLGAKIRVKLEEL